MSRDGVFQASLEKAAFWLSGAAAASIIISIAVSQILLALAFAALLMSGEKLRLPPIRLPLALFITGTLLSLAFSGEITAGFPQIRKLFVFLMLVVTYSTFRDVANVRGLVLWWIALGTVAAARGIMQFAHTVREAHLLGKDLYEYYLTRRITGFMGHWMTFSGELMIVTIFLTALLFFSPLARRKVLWLFLLSMVLLLVALLFSLTRSVWLATGFVGLYLIWSWRRWLVLAAPALFLAVALLSPAAVRTRFVSIFYPRQQIDSNQHRIVCWRTGWEMVRAHPWLGLGPEQVGIQFNRYVPKDIPRPLPRGFYGHLHSIYVHYAAERGVPTMLALVWFLVKILVDFLRVLSKLPTGRSDEKFLLYGGAGVVIGVMVAGLFELNLGDSEVLTLFLAVIACGYVVRDRVLETAGVLTPHPLRSDASLRNL